MPKKNQLVDYFTHSSQKLINHAKISIQGKKMRDITHLLHKKSGAEGDRTPGLVNAIHALSQLSYSPMGNLQFTIANLRFDGC